MSESDQYLFVHALCVHVCACVLLLLEVARWSEGQCIKCYPVTLWSQVNIDWLSCLSTNIKMENQKKKEANRHSKLLLDSASLILKSKCVSYFDQYRSFMPHQLQLVHDEVKVYTVGGPKRKTVVTVVNIRHQTLCNCFADPGTEMSLPP